MDSADAFGLSPKIEAVEDVVAALDLAAPDQRLELLRDSLKKYGTVIPTVALCLESKAGGGRIAGWNRLNLNRFHPTSGFGSPHQS